MTWPQYKRCECKVGIRIVRLSEKQRDVLFLLMVRCPVPVAFEEIAELVFGFREAHDSTQKFIDSLRAKIDNTNATVGPYSIGYMISRDAIVAKRRRRSVNKHPRKRSERRA